MKNNYRKLSKSQWYDLGGFANPSLFRRDRGRGWEYYQDTDHPASNYDYS